MRIFVFVCALLYLPSAKSDTDCFGGASAVKFIVYLHGMDTQVPSQQELENRDVLKKLSKNLNLRVAIPRAVHTCPTDSKLLCWTWNPKTSKELAAIKTSIQSAAKQCFPKKKYTVIGFSNGGTAVSALLRLCEKVEFGSAITVGATGGWFDSDPKDLRGCLPQITSLIGTADHANYKWTRELVSHLAKRYAPIELKTYEGGHHLTYESLYELLK